MAIQAGPNVKVRWAAKKVKGTYRKMVCRYETEDHPTKKNEKINKLVKEIVEAPRGWMIFFPAGHSLHIASEEEMKRHGFMDAEGRMVRAGLVDMQTGLAIETENDPLAALERGVEMNTRTDFSLALED